MLSSEQRKLDKPRTMKLYSPELIAPLLSEETPFFRMSTGVYVIQTRKVVKDGKAVEVPTNFWRVDKVHGLKGKAKDRVRIEARRTQRAADKFRKDAAGL
jgi:hypothetical protein